MKRLSLLLKCYKIVVLTLLFQVFAITGIAQSVSNMSLSELEAKQKEAVELEDYALAADWKKAVTLKKDLDQAVKNEEFEKAAKLKKELEDFRIGENNTETTTTTTTPPPNQYTPPPPTTYTQPKSTTSKTAYIYNFGTYTPIGIMIASESNSVGFYIAMKLSANIFNESSSYDMSEGNIDESYWSFVYNDKKEYRRASFTLGMTFLLAGDLDNVSLHGFVGIGYGVASYVYQYEQIGASGSFGDVWIKDTDLSREGLELEVGFILDIGGFDLLVGMTTLNFGESMLTAGIGFSL